MPTLFDPIQIGNIELDNRIIMAPMTRSRADDLARRFARPLKELIFHE